MHFSGTAFGLAALGAAIVQAQAGITVKVTVGAGGLLQYSPNNIVAEVGTAVEFSYFPKNHSVTQSSFGNPCHPLPGGFFSGFVPTKGSPSGTTFTITVEDTKPIWIYCGQTVGNHCQSGMVAAINAPTTGNTLGAFTILAKNATRSTSPPSGPIGGVLSFSNSTTTSVISSAASGSTATAVSSAGSGSTSTSTSTSSPASFTGAATEIVANGFAGVMSFIFASLALF